MANKSSTFPSTTDQHYTTLFEALAGCNVLLQIDAPRFTILAATPLYLQQTGATREDLIGKGIFEAFPAGTDPRGTGASELSASLMSVLQYKEAHHLPVQRYDVAGEDRKFVERYWRASNKPVLDPLGEVAYIIHSAEEITQEVNGQKSEIPLEGIEKAYHLFMQVPAIIGIVKGRNHVLELANERALKLWGKGTEIIGKPLPEAVPELERHGVIEHLNHVRNTGKPFLASEVPVTTIRAGRNEDLYFDIIYQPYYETDHAAPAGIISISHEVTELVKAKRKVEESEEKYRRLFESMDQGYCTLEVIFDGGQCVNYRYLETNPTFERHLGITNALGKTILDIAPDIEPKWFNFYGGVVLTGNPIRIEEESKAFNKWFEVYALRIGNAEDRKVGVFFTDITKRKKSEEAVRDSETHFRNLIEQAPISIAITRGADMIFDSINPSMLQLLDKKDKDAVIGKKVIEVLPEVENQAILGLLQNVLQTGETFNGTEVPVTLEIDGILQTGYFNISYTRIIDTNGIPSVLHMAFNVTEKVLSRRRTEESEAKLRTILNSAPTAIGVFVGPDLVLENPNQLMIEVMAAGPGIEGKSFRHLLDGLVDDHQKFIELIDTVRTTAKPFEAQEVGVYFKVEKKTRYFNISFIPLTDESGDVYAVLDVSVDVTGQVLARHQIEASEEKLQTIIFTAPIAMALFTGNDSIIEHANQAFIEFIGKKADVVGQRLHQVMPELEGQPFSRLLAQVHSTGAPVNASDVMAKINRNGVLATEYYNLSFSGLMDMHGNAYAILAIAVNVTQQFEARQKLEEKEADLKTALEQVRLSKEAAELGTFDMDLEKGGMHWDDRCRTLFGISHKKPVSFDEDFIKRLHTDDQQRVQEIVRRAFIKALTNGDYDVEYRTIGAEDGLLRWVRAKGKVYFDGQDNPVRFIGSVLDITDQVMAIQKIENLVDERTKELAAANETLQQTNKELQRSNANLEEFAYAASHDLKEPIRKIHVFADRLKSHLDGKLDADATRYFERLQTGANRMGTLIDDLLRYSHINRGVSQLETVDLNHILALVEEDLELAIREKNAGIASDPLPIINGHKRQLQQLFENLLGNSLKYCKLDVPCQIEITSSLVNGTDTKIDLQGEYEKKQFHFIQIKDNGIGFKQEHAERIFNVFTRLHGSAEYKGTGVGLSIARKVVENHKGHMWAESTPGNGASFKIYLPAD